MRTLIFLLCFLGCSLALADEQLDNLFEQLQQTDDARQASTIEDQIWELWMIGPETGATETLDSVVIAMAQGRLRRAMRLLNDLTDTYPNYAEAWNKRATLHYVLGQYEQSLHDIEKTVALEPRHFGAWSGLGLILEDMGRVNEAITAHETVLHIYPAAEFSQDKIVELRQQLLQNSI